MRKPNISETIVIAYAFYMWFTLTIDNTWFYSAIQDDPNSMYAAYLNFFHTQGNLAITSLVVGFLTVGILFVENYILRIFVNGIGLVYFTILAASYIFSYPNLGLGLSAIITVIMIANINRLIDEKQEERKHKIICDSYKK
jgi:hypothetical protein